MEDLPEFLDLLHHELLEAFLAESMPTVKLYTLCLISQLYLTADPAHRQFLFFLSFAFLLDRKFDFLMTKLSCNKVSDLILFLENCLVLLPVFTHPIEGRSRAVYHERWPVYTVSFYW